MVRIFNAYFPRRTLLLAITEGTLIFAVLLLAAFIRLGTDTQLALTTQHGYLKIALVGFICLFCIYYSDLYDPLVLSNSREVPSRLIQGLGTACLIMAVLYYAFPAGELCRGFVITGITLVGLSLIGYRQVFIAINSVQRLAEPTLIMGEGALAESLAKEIKSRPELGLRLVGYLGAPWARVAGQNGDNHLGTVDDLTDIVDREQVKRVIVAMSDRRSKLPVDALLQLKTSGVAIQEGSEFYEVTTGKIPVESLRISWLIFSPGFKVSHLTLIYKRVFSLVLAGVSLLALLPVIAVVMLAIWLDSPGPVIFRQTRIGKGGQRFTLYKFRTMYVDADSGGDPLPVQENDKRVTRVGRWLRQCRLDELPQLYNILLGQMYFVGPRPFVPNQELDLARQIPLYTQRWTVKPGATGWAQTQRGYCATLEDNSDKLAYDLFYIKNMSIGLDLLILFKTLKIVLLGRGGR
ncbi:MAG TPA: sugar transferase [Candidatus Acidoferrales bacterium]|nr:sugar transferase [Candidatus Acidoferrales bacterium]